MAEMGKMNALVIVRDSDHGFYLDGGEWGDILLPNQEAPEDVEQGDVVDVFVSRDSEDRVVATTGRPHCEAGEYAALEVISVHPRIGAFLDWGLSKDLLLPYREQREKVKPGDRVVVRVLVDPASQRIVATTRINRFLNDLHPRLVQGQEVDLLVHERTPMGYMAIIDHRYRGLLHENRLTRPLEIGESLSGYVAEMKEEGKIDLSLEPVGYGRVTGLAGRILEALEAEGGRLPLGDRSDPEAIRERFATSKKAFKKALGALYRSRRVEVDDHEVRLADRGSDTPSPGSAT